MTTPTAAWPWLQVWPPGIAHKIEGLRLTPTSAARSEPTQQQQTRSPYRTIKRGHFQHAVRSTQVRGYAAARCRGRTSRSTKRGKGTAMVTQRRETSVQRRIWCGRIADPEYERTSLYLGVVLTSPPRTGDLRHRGHRIPESFLHLLVLAFHCCSRSNSAYQHQGAPLLAAVKVLWLP